ncbi:hypothetical protein OMAG_001560 [Candidatus Omnitrophus magneticus]|uniref:Uncharacterized protein n=1 Tax=Candidatus Omnitrophus magneticus TaxID=1609969 RepID=A0A0F0CSY6_9BACT|nr:hypothetical protein OMAG_001560 [Candidatus Omnitrophus magneticus]
MERAKKARVLSAGLGNFGLERYVVTSTSPNINSHFAVKSCV